MNGRKLSGKWFKFLLYLVVVVLINLAAVTLFFRLDLTADGIYSLSKASRRVVSTLSEPLTIKVFFSKNLPAPYNGTERYLHDLLEEYAVYAGRYFNYAFYDVSPKEGGEVTAQAGRNQELARSYGIDPIQIQVIEKDEVKFQKAYMGLVLIHGDMIERIPTVTSSDGLEYRLTTAIQKLNNKVSVLLGLTGKIQATLYLSSSLDAVAPHIQVNGLASVPARMEQIVKKVNAKTYGKIEYRYLDPSQDPALAQDAVKYHLLRLKWPALANGTVPAGEGFSGLVMKYGDKTATIPVLDVFRVPLLGTRYQLVDMDKMDQVLSDHVEALVDINQNLGYLADHGTLSLSAGAQPMGGRPEGLTSFQALVSRNYSIQPVRLKNGSIPDNIDCLVIARPTEPFTDYELFQLDQFLMRGKNLALFVDAIEETMPSQQAMAMGQAPRYEPVHTGLEKLLEHYGLRVTPAYVMDENCFRQQLPAQMGGGERPIYFAPLIKNNNINHDLAIMQNIKGLVAFQASPVTVDAERIRANSLSAIRLFSSSEKSWQMKPPINLNPMFLRPPRSADEFQSYSLAYLVEGKFPSYFAGKEIPEKPEPKADEKQGEKSDAVKPADDPAEKEAAGSEPPKAAQDPVMREIQGQGAILEQGAPGKIFLMAASGMLQDNILDQDGRSPNAIFVANIVDYLNHRQDIAVMRSKQQRFNPLVELGARLKTFIKSFNIVGLPVLVIFCGCLVWVHRRNRSKRIRMMFQK